MSKITLSMSSSTEYKVAEAFRTLRANLQFCGAKYKVIMLTSCMPNDGKSTISFEIANAFAKDGKKVLLMDCDLRKSVLQDRVASNFNMPGTTEIVSGLRNLRDCICNTQYENLDIMFSGAMAPNPAELLNSEAFEILVADARELYDMIIIDSPPLGAVIDAALIAKQCDGACLIISANTVSRAFAQGVIEQLNRSECPVMGVILNRVEITSGRYGSYYKYGSKYYKYGGGYGSAYGYGGYGYGYGMEDSGKKKTRKMSKEQRKIQQSYNASRTQTPPRQNPNPNANPNRPQTQRQFYDQDQDQ